MWRPSKETMFPAKHLLKAEACSQLTNPKMVDFNVRDVFNKESREPDLGHWKYLINLFAQTLKLFMKSCASSAPVFNN